MLWPVSRAEGTAGFVSLPASSPGPSSGVEGSPGEDLRPKDGIFLARRTALRGCPQRLSSCQTTAGPLHRQPISAIMSALQVQGLWMPSRPQARNAASRAARALRGSFLGNGGCLCSKYACWLCLVEQRLQATLLRTK